MRRQGDARGRSARPDEPVESPELAAFRIVGVGASAGGLVAVSALLGAVPADVGMAFAVVMHLDPTHESSLADLLGRACRMPVHQVTDGRVLEPGHVYVIPPNTIMTVDAGALRLAPRGASREPPRPIDVFLRSLARAHDGRAIGVILSGTGSDGTSGLEAIKAEGGITFAQDESAVHADMPRSAVASGCVDAVLSPEAIAHELVAIARHPAGWLHEEPAAVAMGEEDTRANALDHLVRELSRMSGVDFCNYKQSTIRRRIQRRLVLLRIERLEDYVTFLEKHPEEAETLCKEILIHVTSFFRDAPVFEAIRELVFPALIKDRPPGEAIRVWVPGCASGEEVYSLAIALLESEGRVPVSIPIKLFGTDVSETVISRARAGRYSERITAEVSPERLRRFFVRQGDAYVVGKSVRDLCVFARQDATRDPPFSNVDLISCRNLLIYLGPALQRRIVPIFHYALREGGFLVLGSAETVGTMEDLFAPVDARRALYRRKSVPRRLGIDVTHAQHARGAGTVAAPIAGRAVSGLEAQREADRIVLARYAPAGVVIDDELQVLQFRGDTGAFLAPPPGTPSHNVLRMAREGLLPSLRAVIEEGKARGGPVTRTGVRVRSDGRHLLVDIELTPIRIPETAERCFLILFVEAAEPDGAAPAAPSPPPAAPRDERVAELERELVSTRDYLRANVERLEAANEELRAANEEILSSNEELLSTNEELQTAKEELQATNEELLTVNEELQHRNREVTELGDDLTNLLTSVRIPIVMVDRDLRIRRFTPSAMALADLAASDMGRSIVGLRPSFTAWGLEALLVEVLDTFVATEREVQDREGRWYVLSVRPFRTQDSKVDGAVIALTDITASKHLSQKVADARDYAESIVMSARDPLLVLGCDLSIQMANRSFHEAFGTAPGTLEALPLGEGVTAIWVTPLLRERLARVASGGAPFDDFAVEAEFPSGTRSLRLNARPVAGDGDREGLVLLVIEDVTERERERIETERLFRKLQETQRLESLGVLAGGVAHDFNNILTAVFGFIELAEIEAAPGSAIHAHLDMATKSVRRAAELCEQMLAYSGKGRFEVEPLDLSVLVRESVPLIQAMVSKRASLRYDLPAGLPAVEGDAAQLRQVLTNLIINASEALGEKGGAIEVSTGILRAGGDDLERARPSSVPAGEYVVLAVTDHGKGMSAETQARIFDPFFTTKFTGRGLGLAAVLGIAQGHHGAVLLDSELGRGTTFRLLLPPRGAPVVREPASPAPEEPAWRGSGHVLAVDDEDEVRLVLERMIAGLGFQVDVARDGHECLEILRAHDGRIDLVLLDLTMPGLSGAETLREIRKQYTEPCVVLMSGYDQDEATRDFRAKDLAGFLRKPFSRGDLARTLRVALAERTRGGESAPDPSCA